MSARVESNKLISITYSILSEQGEMLAQSDTPIDYVHGVDDRMFPRIIAALEGKKIGDLHVLRI